MINYEPNDSSFYDDNKTYCESIENQLKSIKIDCTGYCNSFGYEIETRLLKNNLTYTLKFQKQQTTQNGVIIPVDAHNYAGTEIQVTGINTKFSLNVGKSSLRRFFNPKRIKDKIPAPYFIKTNYFLVDNFLTNLVKTIQHYPIAKFKLNNGRLNVKIHYVTDDPLHLIADIDKIIERLE